MVLIDSYLEIYEHASTSVVILPQNDVTLIV